jgi:threonine aldolase
MQWIDLRSDTVTQPTPAMREAMFHAEVGDDVYGDDPTVNRLEARAAERLGKEAALFVPSGNFGNQLALFTHCQRGDEVILGDDCHIVWHETGGTAVIAGVQLRTIDSDQGALHPEQIARRIRVGDDIHAPNTGLICLENAHSNGRVIPLANMAEVAALAHQHRIPLHLDGARVFNAATYLKADVREITQYADSVMVCLSKGLAAPVGSILAGTSSFIEKARKKRKLLGGGLRQAGVLAAPGLIALEQMSQRLAEDHQRAQQLAAALASLPGVQVERADVHINLVWFRIPKAIDGTALTQHLRTAGIKVNPPEDGLMRFATHWQVDDAAVAKVVAALREFFAQ